MNYPTETTDSRGIQQKIKRLETNIDALRTTLSTLGNRLEPLLVVEPNNMSQVVTVTKESIDAKIAGVYYTCPANDQKPTNYTDPSHKVEMGLITICIIILENGFKVMGESVCVDPNIYDEEKGKHWAYENAYEKIWAFEGYLLKQRLYEQSQLALAQQAINIDPTKINNFLQASGYDTEVRNGVVHANHESYGWQPFNTLEEASEFVSDN